MRKMINGRTVAGIHDELVGQKRIIDGWDTVIRDTIEGENGQVYFAVSVNAVQAMYLEEKWLRYER